MASFSYVISARKVEEGKFVAEPGDVLYLKVPSSAKVTSPSHEVDVQTWLSDVRDLADGMADQNAEAGDVLLFVHGYNNDADIIMKRQRRLQEDLKGEGWKGLVVAFDWPSADMTLNYYEDRSDAAAVAQQMVTKGILLIATGQRNGCQTNVHALGHSTGAFVIMEAMANAEKKGSLHKDPWRMGQVAFIGGDVSSESLAADSDWAAPMFSRIMRLTNYSNPCDKVLGVSNAKRLGTAPRAGRVGLPETPHPKAVNVDCGDYFQTLDPKKEVFYGTFNHSWHIGNRVFARDLAMALEGGIDRSAIPTRTRADGRLVLRDAPRPAFQAAWDLAKGKAG